jgi:hypothetical protein
VRLKYVDLPTGVHFGSHLRYQCDDLVQMAYTFSIGFIFHTVQSKKKTTVKCDDGSTSIYVYVEGMYKSTVSICLGFFLSSSAQSDQDPSCSLSVSLLAIGFVSEQHGS